MKVSSDLIEKILNQATPRQNGKKAGASPMDGVRVDK
jgi:hypothetical protein